MMKKKIFSHCVQNIATETGKLKTQATDLTLLQVLSPVLLRGLHNGTDVRSHRRSFQLQRFIGEIISFYC
jgi:hypothetical protein